MNQNIKNFIEEGEKEFDALYERTLDAGYESVEGLGDTKEHDKVYEDFKQFISSRLISLIKMIVEERDNQIKSRIANIFASKYENEPRVSERIERAIMSVFEDKNYEPLDTISSKLKTLIKE